MNPSGSQLKPGEMPPIIEPPKTDNRVEIPSPETSTEEKLKDVVAPTPQKIDQKPDTVSHEMPEMVKPANKPETTKTQSEINQEAEKLIDEEPPKVQGLEWFSKLEEKVSGFTDPNK